MGELAVIVPSRGRPGNIARLLEAMDATCRADTRLVVGVDDDDLAVNDYLGFAGCDTIVKPGLRRQLVRWLNVLAVEFSGRYKFIGHVGDDNVPRTVGWDTRIIDSLQENLFCFGDDLDPGRAPGSLSIHIFMRAEVVKTLGYMGPPRIQHMYVDPVWYAWGKATSIEFLPDVVLEHLHYTLGRSSVDESYEASTGLIPSDCTNYNDYCEDPEGLNADILRLGGTPYSAEALAEFNHRLNIPRRWAA